MLHQNCLKFSKSALKALSKFYDGVFCDNNYWVSVSKHRGLKFLLLISTSPGHTQIRISAAH